MVILGLTLALAAVLVFFLPLALFESSFGFSPISFDFKYRKWRRSTQRKVDEVLMQLVVPMAVQFELEERGLANRNDPSPAKKAFRQAQRRAKYWGFRTHRRWKSYLICPWQFGEISKIVERQTGMR